MDPRDQPTAADYAHAAADHAASAATDALIVALAAYVIARDPAIKAEQAHGIATQMSRFSALAAMRQIDRLRQ